MADFSNLSLVGVPAVGEALHEFKHLGDKKRRREKAKITDEADFVVEEEYAGDSVEGDSVEEEEHQLDVKL